MSFGDGLLLHNFLEDGTGGDGTSSRPSITKDSNDDEPPTFDEHDIFFEWPDVVSIDDDVSSSSGSSSGRKSSSSSSLSKRVSFSTVEVREYSLTVGEHPFCKDGLAISLDWHYNQKSIFLDVCRLDQGRNVQPLTKSIKRLNFEERLQRLQCVTGMSGKHLMLVYNHRSISDKDK
jgi:hypothetical protein